MKIFREMKGLPQEDDKDVKKTAEPGGVSSQPEENAGAPKEAAENSNL